MKRMTLKQTLLAVVLAGCAATAAAETVSTMTMAACHLTDPSVTGASSFSNEARTGTDPSGLARMRTRWMRTRWMRISDMRTDDMRTDGMGMGMGMGTGTGNHLGTGNILPPSVLTTGDDKTGDPAPVPEASTTAMMLAGLALLGGMLRKRTSS